MMQYGICKIVSNLLLTYECMLYVCNKIVFFKKGTDFHYVVFDILQMLCIVIFFKNEHP